MLVVACGALAREVIALIRTNGWSHVSVTCLPAEYHNTPAKIAPAVDKKLHAARERYAKVFVAYADCGTAGELDAVIKRHGAERLQGGHCYATYAGQVDFAHMMDAEPGTFFLTDFLARHFERLVFKSLGLDRYPELLPEYFANYRKLVYLAQVDDASLRKRAKEAAKRLGLEFECRHTGYGELASALVQFSEEKNVCQS